MYETSVEDCFYVGSTEFSGSTVIVGNNGEDGTPGTFKLTLLDDDTSAEVKNATRLANYNGLEVDVTLSGRTLFKDGYWNTLCLPFSLTSFTGTPLEGATVKALTSSEFDNKKGELTLNFTEDANNLTSIEAGKPYIVKWGDSQTVGGVVGTSGSGGVTNNYNNGNGGTTQSDPVFSGVTVTSTTPTEITSPNDCVTFKGTYDYISFTTANTSILFLGGNNKLFYPEANATIGAFRAYFQLADGITAADPDPANTIRAFVLNFGDDSEASGIENVQSSMANGQSASWYDMLGRKLNGKPTATGMYIYNGKKVAIK